MIPSLPVLFFSSLSLSLFFFFELVCFLTWAGAGGLCSPPDRITFYPIFVCTFRVIFISSSLVNLPQVWDDTWTVVPPLSCLKFCHGGICSSNSRYPWRYIQGGVGFIEYLYFVCVYSVDALIGELIIDTNNQENSNNLSIMPLSYVNKKILWSLLNHTGESGAENQQRQ